MSFGRYLQPNQGVIVDRVTVTNAISLNNGTDNHVLIKNAGEIATDPRIRVNEVADTVSINPDGVTAALVVDTEISAENNKITNLAEPTVASDATTKNYVDTATAVPGASDQIIYNDGAALVGSNDLRYNNTNFIHTTYGGVPPATVTNSTVLAGGSIFGTSDYSVCAGLDAIINNSIYGVCLGNNCGIIDSGANNIAIGRFSFVESSNNDNVALGYAPTIRSTNSGNTAIGGVTLEGGANQATAIASGPGTVAISPADRTLHLCAHNNGANADNCIVFHGGDTFTKTCSIVEHNANDLSLSYNPVTPGDWSPAPTDLSSASDQLASRVSDLEVVTTEGDILYRDASGLTRLPIGTAGQMLMVNTATTAPEWDKMPMAEIYMTSNATVTTFLGTSTPTKILGTTTLTAISNKADMPANNRLRYTGSTTNRFHIAITFSVTSASANQQLQFLAYKNGAPIVGSKAALKVANSSDSVSSAIHAFTELATNDYIEVWVSNQTSTSNVTVSELNLFFMGCA